MTREQVQEFTSWLGKKSYKARLERFGIEESPGDSQTDLCSLPQLERPTRTGAGIPARRASIVGRGQTARRAGEH